LAGALSVSFAEFMAGKHVWTRKTRAQAEAVLSRFISLMEDRPVAAITQAVAERFKQRLREVPALNGKSIYTGLTVRDSVQAADRIAKALAAGDIPVRIGGLELDAGRARRLVERLSLKTINRDLTTSGVPCCIASETRSPDCSTGNPTWRRRAAAADASASASPMRRSRC
jgi:hypothetical protein